MRLFVAQGLFHEPSETQPTSFLIKVGGPELQAPEAALLALVEPPNSVLVVHLDGTGPPGNLTKNRSYKGYTQILSLRDLGELGDFGLRLHLKRIQCNG